MTGLIRAYVVITIAWMQHNVVHLELEGNMYGGGKSMLWLHVLVLVLSANWQVAQVSNNILTALNTHWSNTKLKYLVLLFSAAYLCYAYTFPSVQSTSATLDSVQTLALLQLVAMTVAFVLY